jgi:hypothetical protein
MSPPVQILECPGGGGHYWAALNPRWYSDNRPMLRGRHWCPDHEEERSEQWKRSIGKATSARRQYYDDMPLPETKLCFNPDPQSHEEGAVLPASAFYVRKTKKRIDGSQALKLDSRCKVCRREEENERRKNWTAKQRKRANKQSTASRRRRRNALRNEKDKRLELEPIRKWLEQFTRDTGIEYEVIEARAGLGDSTISSMLTRNGRSYVSQSVVEKIAVGLDRPYLLSHLYGSDQ